MREGGIGGICGGVDRLFSGKRAEFSPIAPVGCPVHVVPSGIHQRSDSFKRPAFPRT